MLTRGREWSLATKSKTQEKVWPEDASKTPPHAELAGLPQLFHQPVVHVPEELQVVLVHHTPDLLPIALHQLRVAHQLLLRVWK